MVKKLGLLVAFLLSTQVFASGKISVQPMYFTNSKSSGGHLSLSIYEKIIGPFAYNGWTGVGIDQEAKKWFTTKQGLEMNVWRFGVGFGVGLESDIEFKKPEPSIYSKFSYQIW
jgi:hypothetical protein